MLEALVAISILSVFSLTLLPLFQRHSAWQLEIRRQQFAQFTLQNFSEQLLSVPSEDWTPEKLTPESLQSRLILTPDQLTLFPQGRIESEIHPTPDAQGKRILLRLLWKSRPQLSEHRTELTLWLFPVPPGGPAS